MKYLFVFVSLMEAHREIEIRRRLYYNSKLKGIPFKISESRLGIISGAR